MVMGWIFAIILTISTIFCLITGRPISAALTDGAQKGVTLAISIGGSLCLWSGVGHLMERIGATAILSRLFRPALQLIFPSTKNNAALRGALSGNLCANLLGLGNAATPMGIRAAQLLRDPRKPDVATGELCRLVVLNTASIQLIPANVAALRSSLGCATPFDILPAVWVTSLLSAGLGVTVAVLLERVWKYA